MIKALQLSSVLLILCGGGSLLFSQAGREWSIDDYLQNLPEKYRTYSGDYAQPKPIAGTTIKDLKNGYVAYLDHTPYPGDNSAPYPIFEMALFKSAQDEPLLVVSNHQYDFACTKHETFFLRRRGDLWQDVRARVLPKRRADMFFANAKLGPRFEATNKKTGNSRSVFGFFDLHFSPPRDGTRMKVSLDICDVESTNMTVSYEEFSGHKPVWLEWDEQKGVFKLRVETKAGR